MITLQQLEYFRTLAQNGHLTRTAEQLYITQATLSNVIGNLEKQLGVRLFDRVGRSLQLSEAGKIYLDSVTQALETLESGKKRILEFDREQQRRVSLAANNSLVWAEVIRDFQNAHRDYILRQIHCTDGELSRKMLLGREVDFVIAGTTDFSLEKLAYQVFRKEPLYVWMAKTHPLAARSSVSLKELEQESLISSSPGHPFQKYCQTLFEKVGVSLRVAMECDYMMVGQFIEAGLGIALTTQTSYRSKSRLLGGNSTCIPLADNFPPREIALIWNGRMPMSRAAGEFREYLLAHAGK